MLIDKKDYINSPRDADGYRSLHLIFQYKNKMNPAYDNLRLEMQIRTKLQHAWATAVETMGSILGQALKSRQGEAKWLEFFALTSSAFAYIEGCKPVPRFEHHSKNETFRLVSKMEIELGVLERMRTFSIAMDKIYQGKGKGTSYYLVILDSVNQQVEINPYDRDSIEKAMQDYSKVESEVTQGRKVEPVLVSSGSIDSLRRAYPNFFLDTSEFTKALLQILNEARR